MVTYVDTTGLCTHNIGVTSGGKSVCVPDFFNESSSEITGMELEFKVGVAPTSLVASPFDSVTK